MKMQPNFSWQKYEGEEEDQRNQFQYQLQQQYTVIANAVNATIDDESYWLRERPTGMTWVDDKQIYTKSFQGLVSSFPMALGTKIANLVSVDGVVQDTLPMTAVGYGVDYVDPTTTTNSIGANVTTTQVHLLTNGGIYDTYTATITIKYTKN